MRRLPLSLVMLLAFTALTTAQTTVNPSPPAAIFGPAVNTTVNPDIVIARLMSFDLDNDGRLVRSELPERMQNLLAADASGDHGLDRDEIRTLARPAPPAMVAATVPGFRGGGGGYTFGDQISLSTRAHVEGALDDLRLPPDTHQKALNVVRPFMARLEDDASAALLQELDGLMTPRQVTTFKTMLERQLAGNIVSTFTRPDGTKVNAFRFGPDLTMMINGFALPPDQTTLALEAFEGFKARIRPAEADRATLLDGLKDVLSDEERENFGAALQRRPLVKAGGMFAGVVSGIVPPLPPPPPGTMFEGAAVWRMVSPPQRQVLEP